MLEPKPLPVLLSAVAVLAGAVLSYPAAARNAATPVAAPPVAAVEIYRAPVQLPLEVTDTTPVALPAAAEPEPEPAPEPATPVVTDADVRATVVAAALRAIADVGGLAMDASGTACPTSDLIAAWSLPAGEYEAGAHIEPLGPAPTVATDGVNGVLGCAAAPLVYAGFEAFRADGGWTVVLVPDPEPFGGHQQEHEANDPDPIAAEAAPVAETPDPDADLAGAGKTADGIEAYATYEPQTTCSPSVKPGTQALRDLLLSQYPSTRSLGITRSCDAGGRSEHKEGRAFDWGADIKDAVDRAAVEDALAEMLATDEVGNQHALARRMGVMYLIWNRQIWSAYHADAGWREYAGSSPHTDHVHISLSWAGAQGSTSYWSGTVVEGDGGTASEQAPADEEEEDRGGVLGTGLLAPDDGGEGGLPFGAGTTGRERDRAVLSDRRGRSEVLAPTAPASVSL